MIALTLLTVKMHSQNENYYLTGTVSDKYAYIDVVKTYERVAEKGYKSVDLFQKLANSCYSGADLEKAAKWYGRLFAMTGDLDPLYYNRYANSLLYIGESGRANEVLEQLRRKLEDVASNRFQKNN